MLEMTDQDGELYCPVVDVLQHGKIAKYPDFVRGKIPLKHGQTCQNVSYVKVCTPVVRHG